ncbi:hypothetical protein HDU91_002769 [Kappamyces sp. JEL0680]|nr:hypothetical protein HDU91_002769 [Kappamyces sp. JEL0680]
MTRSFEMVIGMLAIQMAGGAFIPIDNSMPVERIQTILGEAKSTMALCHPDTTNDLVAAARKRGTVVVLDKEVLAQQFSPLSTTRPIESKDPAYCIFTSGSTGKPKGVLISHSNIVNYCNASFAGVVKGFERKRWANVVSVNFDVCTGETFLLLTHQCTIVLREGDSFDVLQRVDCVEMVPSLLKSLDPAKYSNLKCIVVSGEALTTELAEKWRDGRRFFNAYGPAEITVNSSAKLIDDSSTVTIGKPLPNTVQYIVNPKTLQLVPIGVVGELLIGGLGVAIGYLNRPDLTAERFIQDPVGNAGRVYRTGDLCKWTPEGELEYVGREDGMVKVRVER